MTTHEPGNPSRRPAHIPSIKDVAAAAGVSIQTVSRVLNDMPRVKPQTRQRVFDAIDTLGYKPNLAARALVSQRSQTIGILTASPLFYGQASVILALQRAARRAGFFVNIASVDHADHTEVEAILEHFRSQRVDGIVIVTPDDHTADRAADIARHTPVVLVAADTEARPGLTVANIDQYGGTVLAIDHLLTAGHRRIAHLSGPTDRFDARERHRAWNKQLSDARLPADWYAIGDWTAAGGYAAARMILDRGVPDAVLASNDMSALGLLRALHEVGLLVPRDVSVIGFDNLPETALYTPALTTVRQDFQRLGFSAFDLLAQLISAVGAPVIAAVSFTPTLVVRNSVNPHRRPDETVS